MKTARLTIVTNNQTNITKAKKLAKLISEILSTNTLYNVDKYPKFTNSYKIEFTLSFENPSNSIIESLEKSDKLCSPWTVKLNRSDNEVELVFNKSDNVFYSKDEFNVIVWGHWIVEN